MRPPLVLAIVLAGGYLYVPLALPAVPNFPDLWVKATNSGPEATTAFQQALLLMLPISAVATFAAAILIERDVALTA